MENDKMFEFMTKLYNEMQNGFKEVNKRLDKLEKGQITMENRQLSFENELKDMKKTLFDGYVQNTEAIKRLEMKIDELSEKVDRHDIKIQVIEGGKLLKRKAK